MPRPLRWTLPVLGVLLALGAWALVAALVTGAKRVPSPLDVLHALVVGFRDQDLLLDLRLSVLRVLIGVAIGCVLAIPVGFVLAWYRTPRLMFEPLVSFFRALPPIALIPLVIVYLGIGERARLSVLAYAAFFAAVVVIFESIAAVDDIYVRAGRAMGATGPELFARIVVPYTVPQVFVAVRVALGVSWATLVAAELTAAQRGLGTFIDQAANFDRKPQVFAGIVLVGLSAVVMDRLLVAVMRLSVRWQDRVAR